MAVYQVEQYYIFMRIDGISRSALNTYLACNGLDDFSIDGDDITIDSIECENEAAQYEEEINQLRGAK